MKVRCFPVVVDANLAKMRDEINRETYKVFEWVHLKGAGSRVNWSLRLLDGLLNERNQLGLVSNRIFDGPQRINTIRHRLGIFMNLI